jgi:phosphoserine phosphatase RsbU/P
VTDKGMPAALFMAFTRTVVRTSLYRAEDLAERMGRANRFICEDSEDGLFVSLFYAQIDPAEGKVCYVNAAHHPPLFYRRQSQALEFLSATGPPLGMEADSSYAERQIQLMPGDFLVLYTDGVLDASRRDGEEFGMERLQAAVMAAREQSASGLVAAIEAAVEGYILGAPPIDDITLLVIKRLDQGSGA